MFYERLLDSHETRNLKRNEGNNINKLQEPIAYYAHRAVIVLLVLTCNSLRGVPARASDMNDTQLLPTIIMKGDQWERKFLYCDSEMNRRGGEMKSSTTSIFILVKEVGQIQVYHYGI